MRRFGSILKDLWRLTRPYFASREKWTAIGLLAIIVVCSLIAVRLTVTLNYWNRDFYNAIQKKDIDTFWRLLFLYKRTDAGFMPGFVPLVAVFLVVYVHRVYFTQWLQIRWRAWLTRYYIDKWLARGAYFRIGLDSELGRTVTDNPDQRIAEDVRDFVDHTLSLGRELLVNVASLFSFLGILWSLSGSITVGGIEIAGYLVWVALIYAIFCTWLTHLIGRPLIKINFRQQQVEADFRYAAVRVRENAEGIALYGGEGEERDNLTSRFGHITSNWYAFMRQTRFLNSFQVGYEQVAGIFPIVVIAPRYFSGALELGDLFQVIGAFGRVLGSMSWFINTYSGNSPSEQSLARWTSIIERLKTFDDAIADSHAAVGPEVRVASGTADVQARALTVQLPSGAALLQDENLTFKAGESTVITGRSGSGKSTLFRALAGIWPYGTGTVSRPAGSELFLPQRPYIPLGTLRTVVCYPATVDAYPTEAIVDALKAAGLPALVPELDADEHWPTRLSGGEQQRVAVARALLAKPAWLFLDEATASLDPESENDLYRALRERLPQTTIVSIAHRPSVAAFHERHIVFEREPGQPGRLLDRVPEPAE
jgi:putative ATP-binding cassette transporter